MQSNNIFQYWDSKIPKEIEELMNTWNINNPNLIHSILYKWN